MTPNKRDLKAYVRFDGSGRVVPGSLILRRKKPKVGKWVEIQAYECCNPTTLPPGPPTPPEPTTTTSSTSLPPVSDIRLKENIIPTGGFVGQLPEYTWEWNATAKSLGLDHYPTKGVLAQEAMSANPEFVMFDHTIGYLRVNYNKIAESAN